MSPQEIQTALQTALAHHQAGRLTEAEKVYRDILAAHPDNHVATYLLGTLAFGVGQLDLARQLAFRATTLAPRDPRYQATLGQILAALGQWPQAIDAYHRSLGLDPAPADVWYNLGNALHHTEEFHDAVAAYREAVARNPDSADAWNNLGNSLYAIGSLAGAAEAFARSTELQPDVAEAFNNLGNVLREQGKLDDAVAACRRAIELNSDYPEAHNNLGGALLQQVRIDEAIPALKRSIALKADFPYAHLNLALALLLKGDLEHAWEQYEWRWRVKPLSEYLQDVTQPKWDGQPLEGKRILLHSEQGYGDTIQFVRLIPQVAALGGHVILVCPPNLTNLLTGFPGVDELVAHGQTLPEFDVHCPLLSLPHALRIRLDNIPADVPYIRANPELSAKWRARMSTENLKVGLVWAGRASNPNDRNRSISLDALAPLAEVPGITFYSLQKGGASNEAKVHPPQMKIIDLGPDLDDFIDTAAVIDKLDLLITVDTAAAHLAGAMAKPVWVLLPHFPDWRWMLDRTDSPWYPTMRLFRRPTIDDIKTPVARLANALKGFSTSKTRS